MHFASFTQPNLACQLRVLYEEDKREKWIRDHPEQYAELLRRGIMLPPDGDPRIMHQDVNGNAQHPSGVSPHPLTSINYVTAGQIA